MEGPKSVKNGHFLTHFDPFFGTPFGTRFPEPGVLFSGVPCISGDSVSNEKSTLKSCTGWVQKVVKKMVIFWHFAQNHKAGTGVLAKMTDF